MHTTSTNQLPGSVLFHIKELRDVVRDSLETKETILCQLEPYRVGIQPSQLSDWSQPIAIVPVLTASPDMNHRYALNRAELRRYMRLANVQMLPKRTIEDPLDALDADVQLEKAEIVSIALDFTGWYGIFANLDGNRIYCGRKVTSGEAKQSLLEFLHSMMLEMEELLRCLVVAINRAVVRGTDHGQIQCASVILSRFVNNHKLQSRVSSDEIGKAMVSQSSTVLSSDGV